jgi:hypothetical protein
MKLIALYVANEKAARGYRKMLEDTGIQVPIYVVSDKDRSPLAMKLPALCTKYNTYEGETAVAQALVSYKESNE